MAKSKRVDIDFAFYAYLHQFYKQNKRAIRKHYKGLTKKYLDFNDPDNASAFLRRPQFEALEMYVFLKEYLNNPPVHQVFQEWRKRTGSFVSRSDVGLDEEQGELFGTIDDKAYDALFRRMEKFARAYPNYIFALTMGTGKTILMATCIFYEFLLANKFPKDGRYCHNALVFAPDRTVLQSLKEIQTFDRAKVVPPEYVNVLNSLLTFHFLEEAGSTLNVLPQSRFNLIISNTQKIILKKKNTEPSRAQKLFKEDISSYQRNTLYSEIDAFLDELQVDSEGDLTTNQRFEKLRRLERLGIFVDEAHHAFGNKLAKDMGTQQSKTSLRKTIDELAANLKAMGTQVVACYNFTGTPYVNKQILPEVVYAYGLKKAIDNKYLKRVRLTSYTNSQTAEFVRLVIEDFWDKHKDKTVEGMRPKLAFFAAKIDELENELRPAVEEVLSDLGIPTSSILVNVGDDKLTSNDDIREFNLLDTPQSDKQFILLVNKGKEGWNCRSLFGVALFRKPRSKVFVLQATMRCLRAIGPIQETGHVYLSDENLSILQDELDQNFRLTTETLQGAGEDSEPVIVKVIPPPPKIKIHRIRHLYTLKTKEPAPGIQFNFDQVDTEKYRLTATVQEGLQKTNEEEKIDLTEHRQQYLYGVMSLSAEIARYLGADTSPILVEDVLRSSQEGIDEVLQWINQYNEILYDYVIPKLFDSFYTIEEFSKTEEEEVSLIKESSVGYFAFKARPEHVVRLAENEQYSDKSFHLDAYCFDSNPEVRFFNEMLIDDRVYKIYFTGMLTHGQSDFFVQYIDPESHTLRAYYPDFVIQKEDGTWLIVEIKGDNLIDDPVVKAKQDYAEQMAGASDMVYKILKGSEVTQGRSSAKLFNR